MKLKVGIILLFAYIGFGFYFSSPYKFKYPQYFPEPNYDFSKNILEKEKIELGRNLFYDPILSKDNSISCASCHSPYNSFAHSDHDLSHGIYDQVGTRNAPALFNLAWQTEFMWDGAINHLDMQPLAPINDSKEMGEKTSSVVEKLSNSTYYKNLFYRAFNDSVITGEHMLKSLAQFQLTLVSSDSKYDRMKRQELEFDEQEQNGYLLFQKNCNSCHQEPLFSTFEFANNGLEIDTTLNDYGRWNVTKQSQDSLTFKTPSLRNLSFTFPYMHDGRFNKLREVLNHYTGEIVQRKNLSSELDTHIELTSDEKVDLISFLLTLNDSKFVFNPKNKFPNELLHK